MPNAPSHTPSPPAPPAALTLLSTIHQNVFLNWFLIVLVSIMAMVGLLAVVPPLVSTRWAQVWAYTRPQMALISILCLALFVLAGLAHQRASLVHLRRRHEADQARQRERAERHSARILALLNVNRMMVAHQDVQTVFDGITRMCIDVLGGDLASLMIYDAERDTLEVRSASGTDVPSDMLGARQKVGKGISGLVARTREPMLLHRDQAPSARPDLEMKNPGISASMVVPVILAGDLVGVINVSTRRTDCDWGTDDVRALQVFAENAGAAIRHAEQTVRLLTTIRLLQAQKDRVETAGVVSVRPSQN